MVVSEVAAALRRIYPGRVKVETHTAHSRAHRPDVTIEGLFGQGGALIVEVSVVRPWATQRLHHAAEGRPLVEHERVRRLDYRDLPAGTTMMPFVCDVLGGMGPETARFVRRLAGEMRDGGGGVQAGAPTWEEQLRRGVSMALAKSRALVLCRRAGAERNAGFL